MPTQQHNQTFDQQGNLIREEIVTVADPLVSPVALDQSIKTMRTMLKNFTDPATGVPTGSPTNAQVRNWLVAITHGVAYVHGALEELE